MTDDDDGLFTPAEDPRPNVDAGRYGLDESAGRYKFPAPPGYMGKSWMRMTNLVSAFSDQERLQLWLEAHGMLGLRADDGLIFDEWCAEPLDGLTWEQTKALANKYAERAREASHRNAAARRGTARHTMMDAYLNTGERTGTRSMRMQLDSALAALDRHGLEVMDSEFRVWTPRAGGVMGRSDARVLCRRTGALGILDWKTQARFWTWQEICGQLAGYDEAPFTWDGPLNPDGGWVPSPGHTLLGHEDGPLAGRRVALVAHMPISGAPVEIHEVDLEYGRRVLACAEQNVKLRSIGRSEAVTRRPACLRPVGA